MSDARKASWVKVMITSVQVQVRRVSFVTRLKFVIVDCGNVVCKGPANWNAWDRIRLGSLGAGRRLYRSNLS